MKNYSLMIQDIQRLVLSDGDYTSNQISAYARRLEFFYGLILKELEENEIDDEHVLEVEAEIIAVERYQLRLTLEYLDAFQNISPERILLNFSLLSLEIGRFSLSNDCSLIAGYLMREYQELLDEELISKKIADENKAIISETLLDLGYAMGNHNYVSLRLRKYMLQL